MRRNCVFYFSQRLLEKSVQAFSRKITTVDDRIKAFVSHVKNMIGKNFNS